MSRFKNIDRKLVYFLQGSAITFILKILTALAGFVVSVLITRKLGAEQSGYYFLAISLLTFLIAFGSIGLKHTVLKLVASSEVVKDWLVASAVTTKAVVWILAVSLFIAILVYNSSSWISINIFKKNLLEEPIKLIIFSLPLMALIAILGSAIQAIKKLTLAMTITGPLLNALFISAILFFGINSAKDAAYFYTLSASAVCLFALYIWYKDSRIKFTLNIPNKLLLVSCIPLLTTEIILQLSMQSSLLLLGSFGTATEVAQLAVCARISSLIGLVLMSVNAVIAPEFSALFAENKMQDLKKVVRWATRILIISTLPIILILIVFSKNILALFGPEFTDVSYILIIIISGEVISVLTGSVGYLLVMTNNEKIYRNNVLIASLLSIVVGFVLIQKFGILGAAITSFIALSTTNLLCWYRVRKTLGINTMSFL